MTKKITKKKTNNLIMINSDQFFKTKAKSMIFSQKSLYVVAGNYSYEETITQRYKMIAPMNVDTNKYQY